MLLVLAHIVSRENIEKHDTRMSDATHKAQSNVLFFSSFCRARPAMAKVGQRLAIAGLAGHAGRPCRAWLGMHDPGWSEHVLQGSNPPCRKTSKSSLCSKFSSEKVSCVCADCWNPTVPPALETPAACPAPHGLRSAGLSDAWLRV